MLQKFDERNRDLIVNINGKLVHRDQAGVSPFDSAVQGGDAVWEGLRLYDGRIFALEEHLARLRSSALALAFARHPVERGDRRGDPPHARGEPDDGRRAHPPDAHARRQDHLRHGPAPQPVRADADRARRAQAAGVLEERGSRSSRAAMRRPPPDCLDPKIHHANLLKSILAKIQANAAGADDAIMLDGRGFIAETNATHLFLVQGGIVRTPTLAACPEGITRATVLDICRAEKDSARGRATCR